ncbi:DUF1489 family protein [Reyranella sp. CPCC 100927]|uniref:DUF1489 family protein n=1 Tax=Reyranella sp. CPCC 100927 TaxID=2599616 RepID=UPI0011B67610|nr:DUF1489 domain-containing protein [Reyranella sp. CPCC 100927]TWS98501.1 DUF1489 family protein [Reyranella sp. CPCC 100927]
MTLHLIKLAVGVDDIAHLKKLQDKRRKERRQKPGTPHWVFTRNTPRRSDALLDGGSLYWVIRGVVRCRQELVGLDEDRDADGDKFCRIKVRRTVVPTAPKAMRAFQGWRYYEDELVPSDLRAGDTADVPPDMAAELKRLGLL